MKRGSQTGAAADALAQRGFRPRAKGWLAGLSCALVLTASATSAATAKAGANPRDGAPFARVLERAKELPRLRSLLVSVDGSLLEERYFNGAHLSQPANLKSASKSILSALVGIALDRGYLPSVRESIGKYFPEHFAGNDGLKKTITIEDLLTMRSGLESTSFVNYGRWVRSGHWIRHVLERPLIDAPGGRMIYSTGNSHLLSALITKTAKMSTYDFARRFLAEPLGNPMPPWARDPQGIYFGGNEMHWTARGTLSFGELYLNGGWAAGRQVLSEQWIRESTKPRTRSSWSGREYGYGWWIDTLRGRATHYAWGHGGQFIFIVPSLKLVAVITSLATPGDGRREHQRALYDIMEEEIIPAIEQHRGATGAPEPRSRLSGSLRRSTNRLGFFTNPNDSD